MKNLNNTTRLRVLLIEPNYDNKFPPIGLMKISTYHKKLGDEVTFYKGDLKVLITKEIVKILINKLNIIENKINWKEKSNLLVTYITKGNESIFNDKIFFESNNWPLIESNIRYYRKYYSHKKYINDIKWDRVYITTLFTFHWKITIDTINFAKTFVKDPKDLRVGGIMATLIPEEIEKASGIKPFQGLLDKPYQMDPYIGLVIENQPLDYSILHEIDYEYPVSKTYFTYMTRGCKNRCAFCAVPKLEPDFKSRIPAIRKYKIIKDLYGEPKNLVLMDNNVLASPDFPKIIEEIKKKGLH